MRGAPRNRAGGAPRPRNVAVFGLVVVSVAACNTIVGFSDLERAGDLDDDSGGSADARRTPRLDGSPTVVDGSNEPRCDPTKPFDRPLIVAELDGDAQTRSGVMTSDELEVFYLRGGNPKELRHGRRPTIDDRWEVTTEPLDPPSDASLSLAAGGLKLYYWRFDTTTSTGGAKNFVVTRSTRIDVFTNATFFSVPTGRPMFVVASDDSAYYAEITDSGSDQLLWRGNVVSGGVFSPKVIPKIHGSGAAFDSRPVLNESETKLYFSSNRAGGSGGDDIYVASRSSKQDAFGDAYRIAELSAENSDAVTWVSNDDCVILLNRADHIFRATRPR